MLKIEDRRLPRSDEPPFSSSLLPEPNIDEMKLKMESNKEEINDMADVTNADIPFMMLITPEKGSSSISPIPLMIAEYAVPKAPPNWDIPETIEANPLLSEVNPWARYEN